MRGGDADRSLHQASAVISRLSESLHLNRAIRDRGNELFKQLTPLNLIRGRGMEAVCCAVLYTACRLERMPRELPDGAASWVQAWGCTEALQVL